MSQRFDKSVYMLCTNALAACTSALSPCNVAPVSVLTTERPRSVTNPNHDGSETYPKPAVPVSSKSRPKGSASRIPIKWRMVVAMAQKAYSLSHTKWMCKYHIVFTPKYRRKVIYNQIRSDIGEILRKLCEYKGIEIIEGHLMPDHVHVLLAIPPKYSVSSVMGYLKGKSSLMIFDRHANLKYKFGNRHFWATGYYVSTVGLNEATIKKYIREQEKQDMLEDKLTTKEYNDPFKGSR